MLCKPVRQGLTTLGFSEPTPPQIMAIPKILRGENALLIAPTGSGKTEAVLLPILSKLVENRTDRGINILYVTPLRALNRDMFKRLSFWTSCLDISIDVRHGDTEMKSRRRQAISPPQMLVTTPETLQAILPGLRMRQHLSHVEHVIIDEVHSLVESKRGVQLTVALERLQQITGKDFQRIGLSATVGNPSEVARFIAGSNRKITIIQAEQSKRYDYSVENPQPIEADYDTAETLGTSPEASARIRRVLELIDSHKSVLVFVNSRTNAEMLGFKFAQLGRRDIAVHHGSLSRDERTQNEDEFKNGKLKALVCTSTLELGIDIGAVDLVIQYLSPRQVNTLVQRVGRSGHRLSSSSKGVIITAFPDDTLEAVGAVTSANQNKLEPVHVHNEPLDVLAHQIVGVLMDSGVAHIEQLQALLRKAYPYRKLTSNTLLDVAFYLDSIDELNLYEEEKVLRKGRKTRKYYFENLSMIPDERRYPVINVLSDRRIGTLGDEFMSLHARVGLNFIVKGRAWRIVQIEEETGIVYVIPSDDPLAAIPGWDGEMIPIPFDLAQETGKLYSDIEEVLRETGKVEKAAAKLSKQLQIDKETILEAVSEVDEHTKLGDPLPTHKCILLESFEKYLIIHAFFGEKVNRTLGGIFDAVLSNRETIVGWWNDAYRILIEIPRKLSPQEFSEMPRALFDLKTEEARGYFENYLAAKFPFSYKMRFVAQRFGALPRGKTMGNERQGQLPRRFKDTPVYDETLREAMNEKVDIEKTIEILDKIKQGSIKVKNIIRTEKPTALAYHILAKYSDLSELMAPEKVLMNNIQKMKKTLESRMVRLMCFNCAKWIKDERIRNLSDEPSCSNCGSRLVTSLYPSQNAQHIQEVLLKRRQGTMLTDEELKDLTHARRTADIILSYGKKGVIALEVKGIGPETASRILGKMHQNEDEFYVDLLKAKIQYLRTREFWQKDKEN